MRKASGIMLFFFDSKILYFARAPVRRAVLRGGGTRAWFHVLTSRWSDGCVYAGVSVIHGNVDARAPGIPQAGQTK